MISVIIPIFNEALILTRALDMIATAGTDCEFILIDDQSTDNTPSLIDEFLVESRVRTLPWRNKIRLGVSGSRRKAVEMATGDKFCFIDAHVFPATDCFDLLAAAVDEHPDSIVVPGLTQHKLTDPWTQLPDTPRGTNYGGSFTFAIRKFWFYMSQHKRRNRWERRRGAYACGMTMTRKLYEHMGGWVDLPGFWSSSDVTMCAKAWYMDIPIIVETKAQLYHGVRGFAKHETPKWHEVINRLYAARVLFPDDLYNDWWHKGFMDRYGRHWQSNWRDILESDAIQQEREWFRARIVKTDDEFMEELVYPRFDKAELPRSPYKVK